MSLSTDSEKMMPNGLAITINIIVIAICAGALASDVFITIDDWASVTAFLDMLETRSGLLSMIGAVLATIAAGGGAIAGGIIGAGSALKRPYSCAAITID